MTASPAIEVARAGAAGVAREDGNGSGEWAPPAPAARRVAPLLRTRPTASAEEAAAIVAALEAFWPRPVVAVAPPPPERHGAWRFSGRWWARPSLVRRPRPWH